MATNQKQTGLSSSEGESRIDYDLFFQHPGWRISGYANDLLAACSSFPRIQSRLRLLASVLSYEFFPRVPKAFGKVVSSGKGLTELCDLTPRQIRTLECLAKQVRNTRVRARVYDVLWQKTDKVCYAIEAVQLYLAVPDSFRDVNGFIDREHCIRGLKLAHFIHPACDLQLDSFTKRWLDWLSDDDFAYFASEIVDAFPNVNDRRHDASQLLTSLVRGRLEKNVIHAWSLAKQVCQISEKLQGLGVGYAKDHVESLRTFSYVCLLRAIAIREAGGKEGCAAMYFRESLQALQEIPAKFRNQHHVDRAIEQLEVLRSKAWGNAGKEARRICVIQKVDSSARPSLEYYSSTVSSIAKLRHFAIIPCWGDDSANAKESIPKPSLLSQITTKRYLDKTGRVVATIGASGTAQSSGKNPTAEDESKFFQYRDWIVHFVATTMEPHRKALLAGTDLSFSDIESVVRASPWVPEDRVQQLTEGLWQGFCNNWISAIHVLAPQVEAMVRNQLKVKHIRTVHENEWKEDEKGLSAYEKSFPRLFSQLIEYEMTSLFCNPIGFNFRNKVAHGLLSDGDCTNSAELMYAWWFVLHLVVAIGPR